MHDEHGEAPAGGRVPRMRVPMSDKTRAALAELGDALGVSESQAAALALAYGVKVLGMTVSPAELLKLASSALATKRAELEADYKHDTR